MFYGDYRDSEHPQDFFKQVENTFDNLTLSATQKCEHFRHNCRLGFDAEEWFDALDPAEKASWDLFKVAFNVQWPLIVKLTKSSAEKKAELFAE